MELLVEKRNHNLIVTFKGELDHHSTVNARQKIDQLYQDRDLTNIVLDLRNLSFMDSSGIGLIMGRYRNTLEKQGKLAIVNDNTYIDKILKMSGLLKLITVYPTIETAVEKL